MMNYRDVACPNCGTVYGVGYSDVPHSVEKIHRICDTCMMPIEVKNPWHKENNEINRQLNAIKGQESYWFHRITAAEEVLEKIFIELYPPVLIDDKKRLAKVSAMCMIAMEISDMHETNMLRTFEELL